MFFQLFPVIRNDLHVWATSYTFILLLLNKNLCKSDMLVLSYSVAKGKTELFLFFSFGLLVLNASVLYAFCLSISLSLFLKLC